MAEGDKLDMGAVHRIEQGGAALREVAALVAGYYRSLRLEGFTREEAMRLAVNFQGTYLSVSLTLQAAQAGGGETP